MKEVNDLTKCVEKVDELIKNKTPETISKEDFSHVQMIVLESFRRINMIKMDIGKAAKVVLCALNQEEKNLLRTFAERGGQFTEHQIHDSFARSILDNERLKHLIDDSNSAYCDYWWINDVGQAVLVEMGITKPIFT